MKKTVEERIKHLATKEDLAREIASVKTELTRTSYVNGLVQLLAIIGSVLAILCFFKK